MTTAGQPRTDSTRLASALIHPEDLTALAECARATLGCQGIIVTGRDANQRTTVAAATGTAATAMRTHWADLHDIDRDTQGIPSAVSGVPFVAWLPARPIDGGQLAHRLALFVEERRMGTIHILCAEGSALDRELAADFGRHAAIAMGARRLRRGRSSSPDRGTSGSDAILDLAAAVSWVGFDNLMGRVDAAVRNVFGPVRTRVFLLNEDSGSLEALPSPADPASVTAKSVAPADLRFRVARVFTTGYPDLANGVAPSDCYPEGPAWQPAPSSLLTVPLLVSGRAIGVMQIADKPQGFAVGDLHDAAMLARPIALAGQLASSMRRLRVCSEIECVLSEAASSMRSSAQVSAHLPAIIARLLHATGADMIGFAGTDFAPEVVRSEGLASDCLDRVDQMESALATSPHDFHEAAMPQCACVTPVRVGGDRVGTLVAAWHPSVTIGSPARRGLTRLAHVIALAIANTRYLQQRTALARLQERELVADELHDQVAQFLFAAQIQLDELLELSSLPARASESAAIARSLLSRCDATLRRVFTELPQHSSQLLAQRLEGVINEVRRSFRANVNAAASAAAVDAAAAASPEINDILVSAARELLVNAAKHAGPCTIEVSLEVVDATILRLRVVDDGKGLSPHHRHGPGTSGHGLKSLRRNVHGYGGSIDITRRIPRGTEAIVMLPLEVVREPEVFEPGILGQAPDEFWRPAQAPGML
jgi:signal transduction histidine kinase